jgi:hypothetical protein
MMVSGGLAPLARLMADRGFGASFRAERQVIAATEQELILLPPELLKSDGSLDVYDDIMNLFRPTYHKNRPAIQCGGWIGYIPLNDSFALEVAPRVPIGNLERLVGMAAGYGVGIAEVEALHDAAADAARTTPKTGKPRKLRQDHKTLHTVIASHPYTMREIRDDPGKRAEVEEWEQRTIAWLRSQYGDDLKSVVRHEDESHFHIHAYVVPTDDPEMRAIRYHPGVAAKRAAMAAGPAEGEDTKALSKRADREYKAAMRAWQDSYHAAVGIPCGLARLGPRRRNLSRGDWQRETAQAKALQVALARANRVKGKVESFIREKKGETESMVSAAATEAATLRAEADAAKAEADRRLAEAKAATDAALKEQDKAVEEQRKARSMMSRVRAEAARDGQRGGIGSCSALAQRGMAVPAGHKEPPRWQSPSEKVPRLFFPRSATRIGAGHAARPEGQEKIVVEESEGNLCRVCGSGRRQRQRGRAYRSREHSDPARVTAGIRACRDGSRGSRRSVNIVPPAAGRGIVWLRGGIPYC